MPNGMGRLSIASNFLAQTLGQRHTAAPDSDNRELILRAQFFDNFGRDPCQHKVYFCGRHQELALDFFHYCIALLAS